MDKSFGFIICRWGRKRRKLDISFNNETRSIFFPPVPEGEQVSLPQISSLCLKWKNIIDQKLSETNGLDDKGGQWTGYLDILQSWRRKYVVRGIPLSEQPLISKDKEKNFLFILERFKPEDMNLSEIFRHWKLNHREQEIVRLILNDFGNKEIATHLGISINTVKAYMKLMLRKVGVHTRAGLISILLTNKEEE